MNFVLMSETAQKCENYAIFKQIYNLELFLLLKWPIHVSDFLKKKFYNINYWSRFGCRILITFGNFFVRKLCQELYSFAIIQELYLPRQIPIRILDFQ